MWNRKPILRVGALALTLLFFGACGSDKALSPFSQLFYDGPFPETVVVDADLLSDRYQYFVFHIELEDPNLSIVGSQDAWTVDGMTGTYAIDDPGGHILAPLPDLDSTLSTIVNSRAGTRYSIQLIDAEWLETNTQGLVGTTDEATVTLTATIATHRNRDGLQRTFAVTFTFVIRDET